MCTIVKLLVAAIAFCSLLVPSMAGANDFPTQARVEFVLRCMEANGGQKYEILYSCVCTIDKIAENIAYDDYVEGDVFAQLRSTPGERGGLFRDPERASHLTRKITRITEAAEKACFAALRTDIASAE